MPGHWREESTWTLNGDECPDTGERRVPGHQREVSIQTLERGEYPDTEKVSTQTMEMYWRCESTWIQKRGVLGQWKGVPSGGFEQIQSDVHVTCGQRSNEHFVFPFGF